MQLTKINKIVNLQDLIDKSWKKGHILSKDKKVFNFFYKNNNKTFNILTTSINNKLNSFLGFIPVSKFDSKKNKRKDICFIALWFKKKNANTIEILKNFNYLINLKKWKAICVIGINDNVRKLYIHYGFKTSNLYHFFSKVNKFIKINNKNLLDEFNFYDKRKIIKFNYKNYKSSNFIKNKYIKNPFYKYLVFSIKSDTSKSIFVTRIIINKKLGIKIFRIIDFSGNENSILLFKDKLIKLASLYNCNYLDFFIGGEFKLKSFAKKYIKSSKKRFLPIYFEPLINEYNKINIAYKKNDLKMNLTFFKGDGDYDRPNIIN